MRILVVGSGAREHALAWKVAAGGEADIISAPGNAGIARMARTRPVDVTDPSAVLALASAERVDLTVVGPEQPLTCGIADAFRANGRLLFGPTRRAAELESSKAFAKRFMSRHGVPTARYIICESPEDALAALARGELGLPVVVKADGLAAGKGVVVAEDRATAEAAIQAAMVDRKFGAAGSTIVLEECLAGREASLFVITDGEHVRPFSTAEDHKRALDGDRGPNTGGMGAFAPSPVVTPELHDDIMTRIVRPVLNGLREEGRTYQGFLYVGLMLTNDGPKVIEFNVRLGDPEAQVVLPMLDDPLVPLLMGAATGELDEKPCRFSAEPRVGVVLASRGYPESSESGQPISGLERAAALEDVVVFHAATAEEGGRLVTRGGRVLTVVGKGRDYASAAQAAYRGVNLISFPGEHHRRDIGAKVVRRYAAD